MASKILVVEDDLSVIRTLETVLKEEGFDVVFAHDGVEALRAVQRERPDLVVLNVTLGWLGGVHAPQETRTASDSTGPSIIVLSTKEEEPERMRALGAGADDYVPNPFKIHELLAHIKTVRRRVLPTASTTALRAGLIEMDLERRTVWVEGKSVVLAAKEFGLLRTFIETKGRVLTRNFLRENVWKQEQTHRFDTRTVDVHVGRLRRKLGSAGGYIITVRGVGYRFGILPDWI